MLQAAEAAESSRTVAADEDEAEPSAVPRVGRPTRSRYLRMDLGSVTAATIFTCPCTDHIAQPKLKHPSQQYSPGQSMPPLRRCGLTLTSARFDPGVVGRIQTQRPDSPSQTSRMSSTPASTCHPHLTPKNAEPTRTPTWTQERGNDDDRIRTLMWPIEPDLCYPLDDL